MRFDFQYYDIPKNIKTGIDVYKEIARKTIFSKEIGKSADKTLKKLSLEINDSYISIDIISDHVEPIVDIINKSIESRNYMQIAKAYANHRVRTNIFKINDVTKRLDKKAVKAANHENKTEDLFELLMEYNSFQNYPSPNYYGVNQLYERIKNEDTERNVKDKRWDFVFAANIHNASISVGCNDMLNLAYIEMSDFQKQLIDDAFRIRNNELVCEYSGYTGMINISQTTKWIIEKNSLYECRRREMLKANPKETIPIDERVKRINERFQENKNSKTLYD